MPIFALICGSVSFVERHSANTNTALPAQYAIQLEDKSCLARSVSAKQRHRFAWMEREVDSFQRSRAILVLKAEIPDFDDRRHGIRTRINNPASAQREDRIRGTKAEGLQRLEPVRETTRHHRPVNSFRTRVGTGKQDGQGAGGRAKPHSPMLPRAALAAGGSQTCMLRLFGNYEKVTIQELRHQNEQPWSPQSFSRPFSKAGSAVVPTSRRTATVER